MFAMDYNFLITLYIYNFQLKIVWRLQYYHEI